MVIDCHRHSLFRVLLSHHILIQFPFDSMGRRDIADVNQGLFLFPLLFLLNLLLLWDILLHVSHIKNLYARDIQIHELAVIYLPAHHSVKTLLHTIAAD